MSEMGAVLLLICFPVATAAASVSTGAADDTDDVLLAELNNYSLGGGCTSLWSFEVLSHDSKLGCKIFLMAKKVNYDTETDVS